MGFDPNRGTVVLGEGEVIQRAPWILPVDLGDIAINPDRERAGASNSIDAAWAALGQAPGQPRTPGLDGVIPHDGGFYREYGNGRIYTKRNVGTFWVLGAIAARYDELGGTTGPLGWPLSNEEDVEGGKVTRFQNGRIFWWPDTGPIDVGDVVVRYTGLVAFGITDNDQLSGSDEPYVILSLLHPSDPDALPARTEIYEDVDAGHSRGAAIDLYVGVPGGVALSATVMEHDFGDPERAREAARRGVGPAIEVVEALVGFIPAIGPVLAPIAGEALKDAEPDIVDAVREVFDLDDDTIGVATIALTTKQLVVMTRTPDQEFKGIRYRAESSLISGEGASYKTYFDVVPA